MLIVRYSKQQNNNLFQLFPMKRNGSGIIVSVYLPRRGRIQEGEAVAVYFAMNITSALGKTASSDEMDSNTCLPLGVGSIGMLIET